MVTTVAIPRLTIRSTDAQAVHISESGDPVVPLELGERILIQPQYFARGYQHAGPSIRLRKRAINAIHLAANALSPRFKLVVWDGLRSLALQREIRDVTMRSLKRHGAAVTQVELDCYVAGVPGTSAQFALSPPPHCTGGAVDVSLAYADGRSVDMGADFDQFDERAWLRFYEQDNTSRVQVNSTVTSDGPKAARRILYHAMTRAGFVPYQYEYWHYEIGTIRAAYYVGVDEARYGAAVSWAQNGEDDETCGR